MADNPYLQFAAPGAMPGDLGPASAANDNPYLDLARQDIDASRQRLKGVLDVVSPINPDQAGEALRLSRSSGLPQQTVQDNLAEVRRQERLRQLNLPQLMTDSPVLARQLTDPGFAAIAQDQTKPMGSLELAGSYVGRSLASGALKLGAALDRLAQNLPGLPSEEELALRYKNNPEGLKRVLENSPLTAFLRSAQEQQKRAEEIMKAMPAQAQAKYGNLEYLTTDADKSALLSPVKIVGDIAQSLPTTLALIGSMYVTKGAANSTFARLEPTLGREAALLEASRVAADTMARYSAVSEGLIGYAQQANQTRSDADKVSQATLETSPAYQDLVKNKGFAPESARVFLSASASSEAGTIAGLIDAITNFYGGRFLGKYIAEGGALLPRVGKGFLAEALTEAPQSAGEQFAQNLAVQKNLNPGQDLGEGVAESAAAGFVVGGLTGGGFSAAFGRASDTMQTGTESAMRANQMFGLLSNLTELASASQVRTRDVQSFEAFMQNVTQEAGPVNTLYIDPKTLVQTLNDAGANISQVIQDVPSLANLQEHLQNGTLVSIPVSEFAARIAGTNYAQALLPHLLGDPSGMSKVQADEFMQTHGESLKAEVEKVLAERSGDAAFKDSIETVRTQVLAEIAGTQRFTKEVNESYATLMSTFYGVTAAKLGITPTEMAARYPIKVSAEGVNTSSEFDQGDFFFQDGRLMGINVRSDTRAGVRYADEIVDGKKKYETRNSDSLRAYVGQRVAIVRTGEGTATAIGEVTLGAPIVVDESKFRKMQAQHLVPEGSQFDIAPGGMKYLYPIENPTRFEAERDVGQGIVSRQVLSQELMQNDEVTNESASEDAKEDAISDDVQAGTQGEVPTTVDDQAVLDTTLKLAKSQVWNKGRDLKVAIQEAVQSAAQAAGVDVSLPSPQSTAYLVRAGVKDALFALQQNPNAIGWYDVKTRQALAVMALVHPEIATDQNARFAFVWALAVTSNGMKVGKNFELAEAAYSEYKKTGTMPTNIQAGQAQKAINDSLALFNDLKSAWGIDDLRRFMLTNFTVGEIAAIRKDLKPGGEHSATAVKGAAIIGPKIGNGFFSNLYGNFDALTMDRWLVRTWGRWTGTLIKPQPVQTAKARERLTLARDAAVGDAALQEVIGREITKDTPVDELALAIQEASMDPKLRTQMNLTAAGEELRKAGNSLAKYLDGQKEAPAGPNERNYIRAVFADMLAELQQRPEYAELTMADLQAVLWYAEKRLYETAKSDVDEQDATEGYTDEEAPDYANAAAAVARARGVTDRKINNAFKRAEQNGRTGDARSEDVAKPGINQTGREQSPAEGFTGSEKRFFIGAVAVQRARSDRAGNAQSSGAYAPASDTRRGEPGLLKPRVKKALGVTFTAEWKPSKSLGNIFKANGIAAPTFYELAQGDEKNAQRFTDAITASKVASGAVGAAVFVYPAQGYQGMRLFLAEDGKSGVAIKPDGDIVSVFAGGGAGRSVMELAVAAGGTKLDAFDTILPTYYAAHGFVAVSRVSWNDAEAPSGWNKTALARYNNGEPDVVFMVLDKSFVGRYDIKDGKRYKGEGDYGKAAAAQGRMAKKMAPTNATYNQPEGWDKADTGTPGSPDPMQPGIGSRGKISFANDITQTPSVITLFSSANLSTFLHESGHFFLEVTADIASRPDAPKAIVDDMQAILKWFGVEDLQTWRAMDIEQRRPLHEKFARGFEAYLFEGSSPNMELTGIFQRFRSWLVNIYKNAARLNVELQPEIRSVFDRMLASSQAIQEAEQARTYVPLFTSKPPFMSDQEWLDYQSSDTQASQDAVQYLERRSLRDLQWISNARDRIIKQLQDEHAQLRKDVRREVEGEVMAEPIYRAREFLKRGTIDGQPVEGGFKLSIPEIEVMYGDNPIVGTIKRELGFGKYGMLGVENGIHPNQVAELFGFSSGDHLVRSLLAAPDPKGVVTERTDQRMLERYGDLNSPQAIARAADEAIHNDARARFVATEANALAKATGRPQVLAKAAKEFAARIINRLKIRDIKPAQYASSAARSSKNAAKATDLVLAATEKRNQLINTYAAKAAFEAQAEVIRAVRYFRRFESKNIYKTINIEYLDQIHALLERFDLRTSTTLTEIDKRASLIKWVESQRAKGMEPVISPELLDEAYKISYKDMSLEDFRGLVDAVKNIEHIGRLKDKLLKARDQREFKIIAGEAADVIRENATQNIPQVLEKDGLKDALSSIGREVFAFHRKFSSLIRQMDGFKDAGKLWELFARPMNEAAANEATMREQATVKLAELYKTLGKAKLSEKVFIPAINASLSLEGRLAIALNMGNETNMRRVMEGENWSPEQVNAIIGSLTREQWNFVQGVWDMLNSYWPEISAKERRMTGIVPEKVEARPFIVTLEDGTKIQLEGGYYPIKFNPARSSKAEADTAAEVLQQMERGLYTRATTARGHTKARVESVQRAMRYDLGVIGQHLNQVIHDLSWHEYLVDANRLLRADPVDSAIRDHYGPEVLGTLRKMMEDVAIGDIPTQNVIERGVKWIRSGASIASMGWNVVTAFTQPLGLTQSMVRIGPKWVGLGLSRWLRDAASMENTVGWITEKSEFMRIRAKTQQREISEIRNTIDKGEVRSAVEGSFFYLMGKLQLVADVPTWLGQYEKSMESGVDEGTAIAMADQAVLDSQGGGQIKDLSAAQRGGEFQKLWTNFYSFFNVTYNQLAETVNETRLIGPSRLPLMAVDVLMLTIVPATLGYFLKALLKGKDLDDEDEIAKELVAENISYLMGTMLGLREMNAAISGSMGYQGPAGARFFADVGKFFKQVDQGEADEAFYRSANALGGVLFHYPALQIERTVRGIIALSEGETDSPLAPLVGPPPRN